ncbi:MAG: cyclophilin family peptidyl-prolyl cis-trans isomerase [Roseivirga sp.]|jgi:cyclophilin family peptidyl-prolyl cis-trans isomerase
MKKYIQLALLAIITLAIVSCGDGTETKTEVALEGNDYLVTIKTDMGEMKAILYDQTPQHKENFIKLAKEGFFDSLLFHRVIKGFMIQGGDPKSKNAAEGEGLGNGGPGYTVPAEFDTSLFHKKGALSAARMGDQGNPERASSGSQFYIVQGRVVPQEQTQLNMQALSQCVSDLRRMDPDNPLNKQLEDAFNEGGDETFRAKAMELADELSVATGNKLRMSSAEAEAYTTVGGTPFLDGAYTVFGQVIQGLDVIDKIAAVQTAPGDRPVTDVRMFVTVEELPRAEIAKKYGNTYN